MRSLVFCIALLCASASLAAQVTDEASFRGLVRLEGRLLPYALHVAYAPSGYSGSPEMVRAVQSISLVVAGQPIRFPPGAFSGLWEVREPSGVRPLGLTRERAYFTLSGGDGEKSWTAAFVFNKSRPLYRSFSQHGAKPEVTRF